MNNLFAIGAPSPEAQNAALTEQVNGVRQFTAEALKFIPLVLQNTFAYTPGPGAPLFQPAEAVTVVALSEAGYTDLFKQAPTAANTVLALVESRLPGTVVAIDTKSLSAALADPSQPFYLYVTKTKADAMKIDGAAIYDPVETAPAEGKKWGTGLKILVGTAVAAAAYYLVA